MKGKKKVVKVKEEKSDMKDTLIDINFNNFIDEEEYNFLGQAKTLDDLPSKEEMRLRLLQYHRLTKNLLHNIEVIKNRGLGRPGKDKEFEDIMAKMAQLQKDINGLSNEQSSYTVWTDDALISYGTSTGNVTLD